MLKLTKSLLAAAAFTLGGMSQAVAADDGGFDFDSQRGEVKTVNPVPGKKVDHQGLVINPTPQSLSRTGGTLDVAGGFKINDRQKKFTDADLGFLRSGQKGVELTIDYGDKAAKKAGVKAVDGAYCLVIGPKKVTITGYNERGAYYGLQTLRQILSSPVAEGATVLPQMVINDYPSMKYRGVVEGFYGTPWSHQVRMSLLDFYGQNKLSDYLYGPKDDPYHSSPYWRQPYPEQEARNISELVQAAKRNRVNFIWAIHPGKDIRWNKEDYDSLVNKFNMMYDLGVRSFAIFFDDIEGEGTNPAKQVELLNDLTRDFVKTKGDVTNLIVCPTDYSQLWAKPGPDGPLAVYGRGMNPDVEVFWTGAVVCSDLTHETLDFINSRIKRPALYWWNYPVTDYCKHILMQGPVYGLDTTITAEECAGVESNPMEHGEASKLALYGVADYAWNTPAYNAIDNWERGLVELMPRAADAYRTFAIHSTDTETGYRRDESWETEIFPFDHYTPAQFEALRAEYAKVAQTEEQIRKGCDNAGLLKEMSPWLVEFTKLGRRGLSTLDLIKTYEQGNDSIFWSAYLANRMSAEDEAAFAAHKVGTMKLQPFYEDAMLGMLKGFYRNVTGRVPVIVSGIGTFPYLKNIEGMLDGDVKTFYTTAEAQTPGCWLGLDLQRVTPVDEVTIIQGRNSVNDGDYMDNMIVEYSADGRNWSPLSQELAKTYEFAWKGAPVEARYIRMRQVNSKKTSWAAVREFSVNPLTVERLGNNLTADDTTAAINAFDENPLTSMSLSASHPVAFDRAQGATRMVMLMDKLTGPVTVTQFDAKGRQVGLVEVTTQYASVPLSPKAARLTVAGRADLYELIQL